jgi:hypothetical protein
MLMYCRHSMSNTDIQLLVAQARSEADNPAFKVGCNTNVVASGSVVNPRMAV